MKYISLVSSGIDSPVATYMMSRNKEHIILVHADTRPFTDIKETEKFKKIVEKLIQIATGEVKTYIVNHGSLLAEYKKNCDNKFTCVFCKRMMLRIAEKIAEIEKADAIITGDSLGQVASQTLQNLNVVDQAISIPVFRPLIGYDKQEVIDIAKKIGTYELSITQTDGCSAVPNTPSTSAKLEKIKHEEQKIDINQLLETAMNDLLVF